MQEKELQSETVAETAAERLCGLCLRLQFLSQDDLCGMTAEERQKAEKAAQSGPCSCAPVIAERKMYSLLTAKRGGLV